MQTTNWNLSGSAAPPESSEFASDSAPVSPHPRFIQTPLARAKTPIDQTGLPPTVESLEDTPPQNRTFGSDHHVSGLQPSHDERREYI
jgi:hypothetical protein